MNLRVRLFDEREAGREEGIFIGKQEGITIGKQEGIAEGKVKMLISLVKDNTLTVQTAARKAGMSEEAFSKMLTV